MGLGVLFNIVSYVLLMYMLVYVCDLVLGSLMYVMGDVYVYLNYVDVFKMQLERELREFLELEIKREKGGSIDGWKLEDFEIKGYNLYKVILMEMFVQF